MRASDRFELIAQSPARQRAIIIFGVCIVSMIAAIAVAGRGMRAALDRVGDSGPDLRFPTNYWVGPSLPFPVIMDHEHGGVFLGIFFALVAVLAVASVIAAGALRQTGPRSPALLVVALVGVSLAMAAFPVTFSVDSYAYAAFGRMLGLDGVNPYVDRLTGAVPLDPVLHQLKTLLGTPLPPDNYGPLWNLLSAGVERMVGNGTLADAILMQRMLGGLALVAATAGLLMLLRGASPGERASRTALLALHPLALYESAAAAHNDMLMIAPSVFAFAMLDRSAVIAGVLLGGAISIKYVAIVALPFLMLAAYRRRGVRGLAGVIVPALAVPALFFVPLWPGWPSLRPIFDLGSTLIMSPMWLANMWLPFLGERTIAVCFGVALAAVAVVSIVKFARDGCMHHAFLTVSALLWSSPLLNPWYVQWLVPAAAATGRWARYAWWFGLFVVLRYVEDALRYPTTQTALAQRIALLEATTVLMLLAPILLAFAFPPRRRLM